MIRSLLILAVLTVLSSAAGANPTLTVMGEGTVSVPADMVTILVSVESRGENITSAERDVQERMERVLDALRAAGVKDDEILSGMGSSVTSFSSTGRVCRRENNTTLCENTTYGTTALERSALIRLKTTDRSRIEEVLRRAEEAGGSASVEGYGLTDAGDAAARARQRAVENARQNAEGMADAAGASLGKVLDIYEYGYPITSGSEETGAVDVTSYVMVTYELEA